MHYQNLIKKPCSMAMARSRSIVAGPGDSFIHFSIWMFASKIFECRTIHRQISNRKTASRNAMDNIFFLPSFLGLILPKKAKMRFGRKRTFTEPAKMRYGRIQIFGNFVHRFGRISITQPKNLRTLAVKYSVYFL